jgi:hypothetical protein
MLHITKPKLQRAFKYAAAAAIPVAAATIGMIAGRGLETQMTSLLGQTTELLYVAPALLTAGATMLMGEAVTHKFNAFANRVLPSTSIALEKFTNTIEFYNCAIGRMLTIGGAAFTGISAAGLAGIKGLLTGTALGTAVGLPMLGAFVGCAIGIAGGAALGAGAFLAAQKLAPACMSKPFYQLSSFQHLGHSH